MKACETIGELLREREELCGGSPAIIDSNRRALSYRALALQARRVGQSLRSAGVKRNDRVAVVLPDGAVAAGAFLGISTCATIAPLNPAYGRSECEFYLDDLRARALVVAAGQGTAARTVAEALNIPVIELHPRSDWSEGLFDLRRAGSGEFNAAKLGELDLADSDDVALMLHTSGTTSRPKLVPLTHRNLCSSARNIAETLKLTPEDLALSLMPLFHIHGLVGVVLSSIVAGAGVIYLEGFDVNRFFDALERLRPTWYSAVPTMHQAIAGQARRHPEAIRRSSLRFIRSSSSALPSPVLRDLEEVFERPVIEAYGMTEASHQMSSNPLPPGVRKPGSVGRATGQEVAIMDDQGKLLGPGDTGEIVIRGPNVMRGYEGNAEANALAFVEGWFRTGDQGRLDEEAYLFITGRLKEIVNRGGEKIAPREVDEILMAHPGVKQAVAFGVRHPTLGEDLAAAVVAKDGCVLGEAELRGYLAKNLPAFKVPGRIIIVPGIPTGPTGKIQRIGLADRMTKELSTTFEQPRDGAEKVVASLWERVLERSPVGRLDNFFSLGGDSIRATQVLVRLKESLGFDIPQTALFDHPTVAQLAAEVERLEEAEIEALATRLAALPAEEAARILRDLN